MHTHQLKSLDFNEDLHLDLGVCLTVLKLFALIILGVVKWFFLFLYQLHLFESEQALVEPLFECESLEVLKT